MNPVKGGHSPWDTIQSVSVKGDGVVSVSTAGHGGVWLSPARAAELKAAMPGFTPWTGNLQWLEEDCDMIAAVAMWPEMWPHVDREVLAKMCVEGAAGSVNGDCVAEFAKQKFLGGGGR